MKSADSQTRQARELASKCGSDPLEQGSIEFVYPTGFLEGKRFLIIDRDSKFTANFKELLKGAGIKIILAPYQAPNANAFAERFIRSIKHECLNKIIHFGSRSLCRSLNEYIVHYNTERNHQGVGNELLSGSRAVGSGRLIVKERLGGFLKFYNRSAA